jgi:hypothetical protein
MRTVVVDGEGAPAPARNRASGRPGSFLVAQRTGAGSR